MKSKARILNSNHILICKRRSLSNKSIISFELLCLRGAISCDVSHNIKTIILHTILTNLFVVPA